MVNVDSEHLSTSDCHTSEQNSALLVLKIAGDDLLKKENHERWSSMGAV